MEKQKKHYCLKLILIFIVLLIWILLILYWINQQFKFKQKISVLMKTALDNQKFINNYLQAINKAIKQHFKSFQNKISDLHVTKFILSFLNHQCQCDCKYQLQISGHKHSNQKALLENQLQKLNLQIKIQSQRTANFIKQFTRKRVFQQLNSNLQGPKKAKYKANMTLNQGVLINYSPNKLNSLNSSIEMIKSNVTDQTTCSPECKKQNSQYLQGSQIKTSKFKINVLQVSVQNSQQKQQKRKRAISSGKIFQKLRKLQSMIFHNCSNEMNKKTSYQSIWNVGISPQKQIIKQQNKNLKCIQSNLVTHLQILEKYKFVPDADRLLQRQQKVRVRQKQLRIIEDDLLSREMEINKKHSEILKRQKLIFLY